SGLVGARRSRTSDSAQAEHDRAQDDVDDEAEERRQERATGAEVERLPDRDDDGDEDPDRDDEPDQTAQERDEAEEVEDPWRLSESDRAEQFAPRRGATEDLGADQVG